MVQNLKELCDTSKTANRIAVMESLIHKQYDGNKNRIEYLSDMESMFNKPAAMASSIGTDMQVAILLVLPSSEENLSGTVSEIKTM